MWFFSSKARAARMERKQKEMEEWAIQEERRMDMLYITGGTALPGTIPLDAPPPDYRG